MKGLSSTLLRQCVRRGSADMCSGHDVAKRGAGTLTLAATQTAAGPVSVLSGTRVASNTLEVVEGLSAVNGTLALAAGTLSIASGSALAGTGTASSVALAGNALFRRVKTDGATTPLQAESLSTDGPLNENLFGVKHIDGTPILIH